MDSKIEVKEFIYDKSIKPGLGDYGRHLKRGGDIPPSSSDFVDHMSVGVPSSSMSSHIPPPSSDSRIGDDLPPESSDSD